MRLKTRVGDIGWYCDCGFAELPCTSAHETELRVSNGFPFSVRHLDQWEVTSFDEIDNEKCDWDRLLCTSFRNRNREKK